MLLTLLVININTLDFSNKYEIWLFLMVEIRMILNIDLIRYESKRDEMDFNLLYH